MTRFAVIDTANAWVSGPHDELPEAAEGQRVIEVDVRYPGGALWSQEAGGFVDVVSPAPTMPVGRFKLLLTREERIGFRAAAGTDPEVADALDLLNGFTNGISLGDPVLAAVLTQMVDKELLGADRVAAILAGTAPD